MNNNTKQRPRLYADFNKWDGDGSSKWLILTCQGTAKDLARLHLTFSEGLEATFYMDDADDAGNPDELEADGYVHFDSRNSYWVAMIDWKTLRHASTQEAK